MFGASSRQSRLANGERRVRCSMCGEVLAVMLSSFTQARCALCQATLEGRVLTPEAVFAYRTSKEAVSDSTTLLVVPPQDPNELRFSIRSVLGGLMRAVGLQKEETQPPVSVQVAKRQKRGRLFDNVDVDDDVKKMGG